MWLHDLDFPFNLNTIITYNLQIVFFFQNNMKAFSKPFAFYLILYHNILLKKTFYNSHY